MRLAALGFHLLYGLLLCVPAALAEPSDPFADFDVTGFASETSHRPDGRLLIQFHGDADWPHAIVRPRRASSNWADATTLALPVENPGEKGIDLFVRIGDDAQATWPEHALAVRHFIAPHSKTTLLIALSPYDPHQMGMQDPAPPVGANAAGTTLLATPTGQMDAAHWASLYLVAWGRTGARTLIIGPPEPHAFDWGEAAYTKLIDRYGQFARASWPGKIESDAQFALAEAQERQFNAGAPAARGRGWDPFGGWLDGPAFAPSGYFRVAQDPSNTWWLVSPLGHAFFSIGIDTLAIADARTFIENREFMFQAPGLPTPPAAGLTGRAAASALGTARTMPRFNQGRWIDFYALNLARKFGPRFAQEWPAQTLSRLKAWNFNTIGNWSSASLWDARQVAYTVPVSISAPSARIPPATPDGADLPDPFSPEFATAARAAFAEVARVRRADPWLLGYFVDNELPWGDGGSADPLARYAVAAAVLRRGAGSAAKQALAASLRARYGTVEALDQAWGIGLRSWPDFTDRPVVLAAPVTPACAEDLAAFGALFAQTYYRIVAQTLHEEDPNHLYLGSRFAAQTPEALDACERWCDIVSFNIYAADLHAALAERLGQLRRPVIIGEFNFSSTDRGPFGAGLVDVGTAPERGRAYAAYVSAAAGHPQVVGVHWFQYLDEPAAGRLLDGENSPFGLVSVTDTPYFDVLAAVRAANRAIWTQRLAHEP